MDILTLALSKACLLVTVIFILGRTGFVTRLLARPSPRDPWLAVGFFSLLALGEVWIAASAHDLPDARLVTASGAGLLAGPWVGLFVGLVSGTLATLLDGASLPAYALPSVIGGLAAGLIQRYRPRLALRPDVGFAVTTLMSVARYGLVLAFDRGVPRPIIFEVLRTVVNGAGVALMLVVVQQIREMDAQSRAAAMAEVRALQARMSPHFLFNSLNTLAALSATSPEEVPGAAARLARFMRSVFEQHNRPLIPIREELDSVNAYLDIEMLRFGERLRVEQEIDTAALGACVPPFLIQPLVENGVLHGALAREDVSVDGGLLRLEVRRADNTLTVQVEDNGPGMPEEVREAVLGGRSKDHALPILKQRLHYLFDDDFDLAILSRKDGGTVVRVRIPFQNEAELAAKLWNSKH